MKIKHLVLNSVLVLLIGASCSKPQPKLELTGLFSDGLTNIEFLEGSKVKWGSNCPTGGCKYTIEADYVFIDDFIGPRARIWEIIDDNTLQDVLSGVHYKRVKPSQQEQ